MIKNWKYALAVVSSFAVTTAFSQTVKDAQRAIDMEQYKKATSTLRNLNKSNASDEVTLFLGDAYLRAGKTDSAAIFYNQALAANPKSEIAMVAAGKAALLKGNVSAAEEKFEDAIKASRKRDPNIYMLIGQAYADAKVKDVTKAIEYLNRANELSKNKNPEVYVVLGDVQQLQPNGGGPAMTSYDRALQLDKNLAKAHYRRGQLYVRSRNYNEAQAALQAALTADPNFAPAYRELGEMFYFAGKYDQALENFRKYISMAENTPETRAKYASFLFLTKDYAGTIKEAQEVLKREPKNEVMNRLLAYSLFETNKNAEALAAMENYFKVTDPSKVIASDYAYYGRMLAEAGKNDLAQTNLDKALQLDPDNEELMNDIASFYVKQKQYPKAIAIHKAKIEAKPSRTDNFRLAEAYYAADQYASADSLYAGLLKEVPNYSPAILRRAEIAETQDKDQSGDAKPYYEAYIKVINEDPAKASSPSYKGGLMKANYYLGYQAYKAKDYATARKYWEEVLRLDPGNKEATAALKNVDALSRGAGDNKSRSLI